MLPKGTHEYARFIRPSELAQWCRDAGLTLEVRASNSAARKFYDKNHFIDIAIRKNYYRSPVEDAIVMYRVLPEDPSV